MLTIYAHSFMTATRSTCVPLRSVPAQTGKRRWWHRTPTVCVDLLKL